MIRKEFKEFSMKVVPQITGKLKHARRGQKALPAGRLVYCIEYENGGFFPYSYLREKDAIAVIQAMKNNGTNTEQYRGFNYAQNVDYTMHVEGKD